MTDTHENHATIRYTADVVAVTEEGRVLLIKRGWDPYEGHWVLPGGHVDEGETGLQAAVTHDELRLVGVWDQLDRDPRGRRRRGRCRRQRRWLRPSRPPPPPSRTSSRVSLTSAGPSVPSPGVPNPFADGR